MPRYRVRLTLADGRSSSRVFATWDEADGAARAALEELGGDSSGATTVIEEIEAASPASPGALLSTREAAALLGVSLSTFKDYVRAELPAVEVGRRVLFERKDVEAWARANKAAGRSASPQAAAGRSTSSGSVTLASGSNEARASQILTMLRSKPRGSTRTS
jgi:excisionase family DNA binding protein